jgi:hypothetical protein
MAAAAKTALAAAAKASQPSLSSSMASPKGFSGGKKAEYGEHPCRAGGRQVGREK